MSHRLPATNKSLGQHWLGDDASLQAMVDAAAIGPDDTVLEIGPGPGALTTKLVATAKQVVAVEFDADLARDLPSRVPAQNLQVVHKDILQFNLGDLPEGYKVAANIPYYLTNKILRTLCESANHFSKASILVQKEVAERVCAGPGNMSMLSVSVQFFCQAELGQLVPAGLFTPPPKVDSQIIKLTYRDHLLFDVDIRNFFRIVKSGFSQRRKTLLNSLSAGLQLSREETSGILISAGVDPKTRAQSLSLDQWYDIYKIVYA